MNGDELRLGVVGINHKTSTVEDRECLTINSGEISDALNSIKEYEGIEGIIIVSTCNRLEFYMALKPQFAPINVINQFYEEFKNISKPDKFKQFYVYEGNEAARHLFRVISGLDSLIIGEYQIQSQVKQAYSIACEQKSAEKFLHKLYHAAFRTGKKVRSQTKLGTGTQSVSGAAAKIMLDNLKSTDRVAIIGVNENTRIIAESLTKAGFNNLTFVNRTLHKAQKMAEDYGCKSAGLAELKQVLAQNDAVFSCTGSPVFIAKSEMLKSLADEDGCPRLIVDMALPRDFDTTGLPLSVKSFNISDIKNELGVLHKEIESDIPIAEKIIEDEVRLFEAWSEAQTNDVLAPYAEKLELIRQEFLEESRCQFTDSDFQHYDKFSRHLLHRLQSTFVRILANGRS